MPLRVYEAIKRCWPRNALIQMLALGNAGLFLVILLLIITRPSLTPSNEIVSSAQQLKLPSSQRTKVSIERKSIEERPLFHASRKPRMAAAPAAPSAPALTNPTQQYKLTGVIDAASGERFAYVHQTANNETIKVKVGDSLGAWQVLAVTRDSLSLERDEQRFELALSR